MRPAMVAGPAGVFRMTEPDSLSTLFVESYNLDLAALSSSARVALATACPQLDRLELRDETGKLLCLIPADTTPEMADIAYRLYIRGRDERSPAEGRRPG